MLFVFICKNSFFLQKYDFATKCNQINSPFFRKKLATKSISNTTKNNFYKKVASNYFWFQNAFSQIFLKNSKIAKKKLKKIVFLSIFLKF